MRQSEVRSEGIERSELHNAMSEANHSKGVGARRAYSLLYDKLTPPIVASPMAVSELNWTFRNSSGTTRRGVRRSTS